MNWLGWALLSAFFAALTAVLGKIGVADVNPNLATAIRTTVILFFTWALVFLTGSKGDWNAVMPRSWWFLVASGLTTGLSWLCYFRALKLGEISQVAPIDKLSIVIAILMAMVFLGERVALQQAVGIGLIVAGVLVMIARF